jgi:hypothetical protein
LVLASGLAACGSSSSGNGVASKSPEAIVAAATQAIDGVRSVHVAGSTTSGSSKISLDLSLVSGRGGSGQMSIAGTSFQIVALGQFVYIKAGSDFWRRFANQQVARALEGKWLKAPTSGQFGAFASLTNLKLLFGQLLARHGTLVKGATSTVNGQQAVAVTDKSKGGTLYVAASGKPYPLKIEKGGTGGGSIAFDRIDQPVTLTAPASSIELPS